MLAAVLALGQSLAAQTPAPAKPPAQPAATPPPPSQGQKPAEAQQEPYSYKPEGRRDPFVSLVARGTEPSPQSRSSSAGVGGLTTGEISVRGIVQTRGAYVAMVLAPDGKTYIVHVNDRLVDGVVKQITPQGIVVLQEVNDPLSLVKQREVRKNLRSAEEGK
jgi:Tfp pilus assembly protein PilP